MSIVLAPDSRFAAKVFPSPNHGERKFRDGATGRRPDTLILHYTGMPDAGEALQWLCNPACKGLCPLCGANRNVTSCSCRMEPAKHPLSALQQLLTEKEGKVEQAPQRREAATFASQDESEV